MFFENYYGVQMQDGIQCLDFALLRNYNVIKELEFDKGA
jgi:hypothetical protein